MRSPPPPPLTGVTDPLKSRYTHHVHTKPHGSAVCFSMCVVCVCAPALRVCLRVTAERACWRPIAAAWHGLARTQECVCIAHAYPPHMQNAQSRVNLHGTRSAGASCCACAKSGGGQGGEISTAAGAQCRLRSRRARRALVMSSRAAYGSRSAQWGRARYLRRAAATSTVRADLAPRARPSAPSSRPRARLLIPLRISVTPARP